MLSLSSFLLSIPSYFLKVDEPTVYKPQDLPHGSVYSLDSHHSHFVLVEEDPNRPGATSEMRVKLLKHISLQRTGYGGKNLLGHCWEPIFDLSSMPYVKVASLKVYIIPLHVPM